MTSSSRWWRCAACHLAGQARPALAQPADWLARLPCPEHSSCSCWGLACKPATAAGAVPHACRHCWPQGTTYNSYLIFGADKTALVDASHEKFRGLYMRTLNEELAKRGRQIDYVLVSHTEPDHSGVAGRAECSGLGLL